MDREKEKKKEMLKRECRMPDVVSSLQPIIAERKSETNVKGQVGIAYMKMAYLLCPFLSFLCVSVLALENLTL